MLKLQSHQKLHCQCTGPQNEDMFGFSLVIRFENNWWVAVSKSNLQIFERRLIWLSANIFTSPMKELKNEKQYLPAALTRGTFYWLVCSAIDKRGLLGNGEEAQGLFASDCYLSTAGKGCFISTQGNQGKAQNTRTNACTCTSGHMTIDRLKFFFFPSSP